MRRIERVAVLGAGVMGAAIAAHLANSVLQVLLLDRPPEKLTDEEAAQGLTLAHAGVKSRLARNGVKAVLDARPAAFYRKDYAELIAVGNFDDDAQKLKNLVGAK